MGKLLDRYDPSFNERWQVDGYHFPPSLLFGANKLATDGLCERDFTYRAIRTVFKTCLMTALISDKPVYPSTLVINESQFSMGTHDPKYRSITELVVATFNTHTQDFVQESFPFSKNAKVTFLHESQFSPLTILYSKDGSTSSPVNYFMLLREVASRYDYTYTHDDQKVLTKKDRKQENRSKLSQGIANTLIRVFELNPKDSYPVLVLN
ncbi:MAG: hypothetical protein WCO33_01705 [bacterium]